MMGATDNNLDVAQFLNQLEEEIAAEKQQEIQYKTEVKI